MGGHKAQHVETVDQPKTTAGNRCHIGLRRIRGVTQGDFGPVERFTGAPQLIAITGASEYFRYATHTFEPGKTGISYDDHGLVKEVFADGPAHTNGIRKVSRIVKALHAQYSKPALVVAEASGVACQATCGCKDEVLCELQNLSKSASYKTNARAPKLWLSLQTRNMLLLIDPNEPLDKDTALPETAVPLPKCSDVDDTDLEKG